MLKQILIIILLTLPLASAATIQGNVYNNYLKPSIATVEINTDPTQRLVVNNNYKFNMPLGTYTIIASYKNLKTSEEITITKEGLYILDLIMFPNFEDEESLMDFNIDMEYEKKSSYWYVYLIIIGIILIIISRFIPKKKKKIIKEDDDLTKKVISFIKEKGGRVTQKEIRKQFPLSEAKISLVITELESKGKIKKIKKGRSNVIIIK